MKKLSKLHRNLITRISPVDLLVSNVGRTPDKTAVVYNDNKITYRDFNIRINRLAHALADLGIQKGDRLAIWAPVCDQVFIYWYASMKLGAIMVPINYLFKEDEIKYVVNNCQAKMLVVENGRKEITQSISEDLKTVEHFGVFNLSRGTTLSNWIELEDLQHESFPSNEPEAFIEDDDPAVIIYTSGTESSPKGAMIRHSSFVTGLVTMQINFEFNQNMVFLGGLPVFHLAGLWNFSSTIGVGGTVVLMSAADPDLILKLTDQAKVTHWSWVTTLFVTMLQSPDINKYDLKSLKVAAIFGSYVPQAILNKWKQHAPDIQFLKGYGLTECLSVSTIKGNEEIAKRPDSVGLPQSHVQVKIQSPDGQELPAGEEGEIVVRCPLTMVGYYKDDEKTDYVMRGGWLHTGDIGKLDEEGYLYFTDRVKDMIKTGGENVASPEVEEVLLQHPKVSEVAVIGLKHPIWLEAVTAGVTPVPGEDLTEKELVEYCKTQMAGFKVPKKIILMDSLPKNAVGKILKQDLRKSYESLYD